MGAQGSRCRVTNFNSTRIKETGWSRGAKRRFPNGQWRERKRDVDSQLHFLLQGTSVEQQVKLPSADKPHVSDSDGLFPCGSGFPRGCRIANLQISSAKAVNKADYHRASPSARESISL